MSGNKHNISFPNVAPTASSFWASSSDYCLVALDLGWVGCPLVQDAGIQSHFAIRRWWRGRWGGYGHCGTRQERSTLQLDAQGLGWLFAKLLLQHPNQRQQTAWRARHVMSASCDVTQGVDDTWTTCPTFLRGIWTLSRNAGFRCWSWLSAHV